MFFQLSHSMQIITRCVKYLQQNLPMLNKVYSLMALLSKFGKVSKAENARRHWVVCFIECVFLRKWKIFPASTLEKGSLLSQA